MLQTHFPTHHLPANTFEKRRKETIIFVTCLGIVLAHSCRTSVVRNLQHLPTLDVATPRISYRHSCRVCVSQGFVPYRFKCVAVERNLPSGYPDFPEACRLSYAVHLYVSPPGDAVLLFRPECAYILMNKHIPARCSRIFSIPMET
ncbi:hypothetical protein ZHAS_00015813 [Anopheles sinensis]|uniref:Uncharacterized protein n=1 Tax=Anopheles sinensis TaxID=74873 RepID=A0A084WC01_ANOSI|nr:hypothetical protein ZHAS_00015813 [Anopheles sinensis]